MRMAQMDEMEEWEWTGNGIGDSGAAALSDVLKSEETVLSSISLYGVLPFCQSTLLWMCFARAMICDVCGCGNRKRDWGRWCESIV